MSEQQSPYVLNPHYQQWVLDQDEADDLVSIPADHIHKWGMTVIVTPASDGNFENEVEAWCQCGASLSQAEIQAILNRTVQS